MRHTLLVKVLKGVSLETGEEEAMVFTLCVLYVHMCVCNHTPPFAHTPLPSSLTQLDQELPGHWLGEASPLVDEMLQVSSTAVLHDYVDVVLVPLGGGEGRGGDWGRGRERKRGEKKREMRRGGEEERRGEERRRRWEWMGKGQYRQKAMHQSVREKQKQVTAQLTTKSNIFTMCG